MHVKERFQTHTSFKTPKVSCQFTFLCLRVNVCMHTLTFTGFSSFVSIPSSIFTTPIPFSTLPKTTCFPSRCGVGTVVIKNWEPLVLGPALAMLRRPGLSCCGRDGGLIKHNFISQEVLNPEWMPQGKATSGVFGLVRLRTIFEQLCEQKC